MKLWSLKQLQKYFRDKNADLNGLKKHLEKLDREIQDQITDDFDKTGLASIKKNTKQVVMVVADILLLTKITVRKYF